MPGQKPRGGTASATNSVAPCRICSKEKFEFHAWQRTRCRCLGLLQKRTQETLGKTFRPYENQQLFSLALDREFPADNDRLLALLGENFYVVPVELGEDPSDHLETERAVKGSVESTCGMGKCFFGIVTKQRRTKDGRQEITRKNIWHFITMKQPNLSCEICRAEILQQ